MRDRTPDFPVDPDQKPYYYRDGRGYQHRRTRPSRDPSPPVALEMLNLGPMNDPYPVIESYEGAPDVEEWPLEATTSHSGAAEFRMRILSASSGVSDGFNPGDLGVDDEMEDDLGGNPWDETPTPSQPEKTPTGTHIELDDVDQALLEEQQVHTDDNNDDDDNDWCSDKNVAAEEQDPKIVRKFPDSV